MKIYSKLIILGSGPAGLTSAIYSSRFNIKTTLITGNNEGGQLSLAYNIENWPGTHKKLSGYELYKNMYNQAKKFNTNIIIDNIYEVNFTKKILYLFGEENNYICNSLIIATGSNPNKIGIPGEQKYFGNGISTCTICDGLLYKNKDVAVIGGGNTAIEDVIFLSKICSKVYLIHRKNNFKADNINIDKLNKINNKKIFIYKNNNAIKINKNIKDKLNLTIENNINKEINNISISGIFIAIGYSPNTKIFKNKIELTESNHIKICMKKNNFTSTSIKGIFAAGDVVDSVYRQAITASALGCIAAIDVKNYLL